MTFPSFVSGEVLRAADMNAVGLWLVKTQTIGTGVSSVPVTGAFSSEYDNYKITITGGVSSTTQAIQLQLTGSTTGYYGNLIAAAYNSAVVSGNQVNNGSAWTFAGVGGTNTNFFNVELMNPFLADETGIQSYYLNPTTTGLTGPFSGYHASATSFTGFTLVVGGTLTGGTIRVYGYKN